jgi:hypothetical protein
LEGDISCKHYQGQWQPWDKIQDRIDEMRWMESFKPQKDENSATASYKAVCTAATLGIGPKKQEKEDQQKRSQKSSTLMTSNSNSNSNSNTSIDLLYCILLGKVDYLTIHRASRRALGAKPTVLGSIEPRRKNLVRSK